MPVGFEEDRIHLTADRLRADEVVLIVNRSDGETERQHRDKAVEELEKLGYEPKIVECDIFDLYESLGVISSEINQFGDEEVYVNIASGSKVTAIAGMLAAMMNDVTAYYVRAKDYKGDVPRGIADITQLPSYPIYPPDVQHVQILEYLLENQNTNITKSDLIDYSEEKNLPFISDRDISRKAKYRLIDNHIIEPLLNEGYLRVVEDGRNRLVDITDDGEDLVQAFGYMLDLYDFGSETPTLTEFNQS